MKSLELFKNFPNKRNQINQPFIIAEAGVNHEGNLSLAFRLIEEALKEEQMQSNFRLTKQKQYLSRNSPPYWDLEKEPTSSQYQLFKSMTNFEDRV